MRRLTILILIFAGLVTLCQSEGRLAAGRSKPRGPLRKPTRKIIQLTEPKLTGPTSLEEALAKRRSVRQFSNRPLGFAQIGQLAWAGQGITEPQKGLRTAPSAGAIYPIELYFVTPEGLFVYQPHQHALEQTITLDIRGALAAAASMQESVARAGCNIIVAGSSRKLASQFRDKARTFMLLEAGHVAQNIQLQAVCLGLGSVPLGGIDTKAVTRVCKLPKSLEAIYVISVGYPVTQQTTTDQEQNGTGQTPLAKGKKAVLIIPSQNFRDDELIETKRALDMAGVQTVIASSKQGIIGGMLGNIVEATIALNRLSVDDYDAIIFIGGPGVEEYFDNAVAKNIARDAAGKRKVLAAISAAPTVLANAGALTGRRATAFMSEREKIQQAGAVYTGAPIERDAFLITCSGPAAAPQFGITIAQALADR